MKISKRAREDKWSGDGEIMLVQVIRKLMRFGTLASSY